MSPDQALIGRVLEIIRADGRAALARARAQLEELRAIDPAAAAALERDHPELLNPDSPDSVKPD